ncbi:hypothetical protein GCM10017771_15890 [Streptomyces capitiformicae]|uniref:Uncharacterized protein n=2 Tax=Streptomyces capitiformicae TaxID=2014920 RepID=A0A919GHN3_9ACTN|nr:hypothetical protein GCM10017771_15890 [Streptomyces capitiformicae]
MPVLPVGDVWPRRSATAPRPGGRGAAAGQARHAGGADAAGQAAQQEKDSLTVTDVDLRC